MALFISAAQSPTLSGQATAPVRDLAGCAEARWKFCGRTRARFDHSFRESVGSRSANRTLRLWCHQVGWFRENKF